jgi:hypothetical protein
LATSNPFFDWVASASRFVDFDVPTAADLNTPLDEVTAGFDAVDVRIDAIDTDLAGLTSPVQTQLDAKADITGETYSGTHNFTGATTTVATQSVGDATTKVATTAFVAATALVSALPGQTANGGKTITTDGTNASWTDALNATVMRFVDGADTTKKLAFDVSGFTTATTRTVTVPNRDGTMAMLGDSASQAQMEEGTNIYTFATPANVQWHQSAAKAWIKCNAAGAISVSYNVTSITDDGPGLVTVTLATDFSSADYAIAPTAFGAALSVSIAAQAAGSFQLRSDVTTSGAASDPTFYYAACFGDQA